MKVLHIISGLKNGGAEAVLLRVVSDKSSNFQHEVVSLSDEGFYGKILKAKGIKVTALNFSSVFSVFFLFLKLVRIIRLAKPDIVQTWMYHADVLGGLASKILGVKHIFWGVHSTFLNPGETKILTKLSVKLSNHLSYVIPRKIVCCSETALFSHKKIGYCSSKLIVVNNGFDTALFKPDNIQRRLIRDSLGLAEDKYVMGMIARWDRVKDHQTFFKALEIAKSSLFNWKCLLVGEGMVVENEVLMNLIRQSSLEDFVICLGSRQDIPSVLNSLDVHVLSSSAESFGNVTAEAMACGIPCIMTDVGEARNFLNELGWIVPIRNPIRLSEILIEVFEKFQIKEMWNLRKFKCSEIVKKKYDIGLMTRSYENVWKV
jgi:glycosyltransferase involved in cell wall biosynthesis